MSSKQELGSMLRRTSHHVRRQQELFALRARKAGESFVEQTQNATRDLATAVRGEADAWGRYVVGAVAPRSLERTLLVRVSVALQALDQRVRGRIDALGRRQLRGVPRKRRVKRTTPVRTH